MRLAYLSLVMGLHLQVGCSGHGRVSDLQSSASVQAAKHAIVELTSRVKAHPLDASAIYELAKNYWLVGDLQQAEHWYRRTLELSRSPDAHRELAAVLAQRGHYLEARTHAERYLEIGGNSHSREWTEELLSTIRASSSKVPSAVAQQLQRSPDGTWTNSVGMTFVEIPAGTFQMGRDDGPPEEAPAHEVTVSGFLMGKHEVTVGDFRRFLADSQYRVEFPPPTPFGRSDADPVVQVSWKEARAFTIWLSTKERATYRLPSEAEWEYGARGSDGRTEPWGLAEGRGQFHGNWGRNVRAAMKEGGASVAAVGGYPAGTSAFGLLDMAGNASEWCLDLFDGEYYRRSPLLNPFGPIITEPEKAARRVLRGSSWKDSIARGHATLRKNAGATQAYSTFGFRVVREGGTSTSK